MPYEKKHAWNREFCGVVRHEFVSAHFALQRRGVEMKFVLPPDSGLATLH
jgi:hypothetical protein